MKMNKIHQKTILLFLALICNASMLLAQAFEIKLSSLEGMMYQNTWYYFHGGIEMSLNYRIPDDHFNYSFGLNARTVQWGTQVCITSGISRSFGKIFELEAELHNGIALFYQKPLYVYAIGLTGHLTVLRSNKIITGVFLGGRYTHCPAYGQYGNIDHVLEIPLGVFLRF